MQLLPLNQDKIDLIDIAFSQINVGSFADLGGIWGVEGGYTFYTLNNYDVSKAILVDTHVTDFVRDYAQQFTQLQIVSGNFGDDRVAHEVGNVDAILLFDVLLHQVSPDWDSILEKYSHQTDCLIIYNQQWVGSEKTIRLLQLGEEEYFKNVPHEPTEVTYSNLFQKLDEKHPDHDRTWRDVHHIWQWGITDTDLVGRLDSLGFQLQLMENCGKFGNLANFENHAFIFTK